MVTIHILGTSHIASQSVNDVRKQFAKSTPHIVALELDKERLHSLLNPQEKKSISLRSMRVVGFKGWLFMVIGAWVEKKLGGSVGVAPGADMLEAYKLAQTAGTQIALIDRPIAQTLKRISQEFTWKEKRRLLFDILKGIFMKEKVIAFDLRKVPDASMIEKMLEEMRPSYPSLYKVLVEERNVYMARRLAFLAHNNPDKDILAVVGAGHARGIGELLKSPAQAS